jgi:hypothetical protein
MEARIVRVNVAGQAMLDRGSVLHSPNGKLVAADPNAARICHDRGRSQSVELELHQPIGGRKAHCTSPSVRGRASEPLV